MIVGEVMEETENQVLRRRDVAVLYEAIEIGKDEPEENYQDRSRKIY